MNDPTNRHTILESSSDGLAPNVRSQPSGRRTKRIYSTDTQPFHPTQRPPVAILTIFDDGKRSGETIRIRTDQFQIGRTEGDVCIPHDDLISARHVSIGKHLDGRMPYLTITDLQSRNGMYVKVNKARLENGAEILIGAGHYRFERPEPPSDSSEPAADQPPQTLAFEAPAPIHSASLVELISGGKTSTTMLVDSTYWIGRDLECRIRRENDFFTDDKHAQLRLGKGGHWSIENNESTNGVWLRMPKVTLTPGQNCDFRLGEQLFHMKFGI